MIEQQLYRAVWGSSPTGVATRALEGLVTPLASLGSLPTKVRAGINIVGHVIMKYVRLGSTGVVASTLCFGCSTLGGRVGPKQSLKALATAFDLGITYYDTARSAGLWQRPSIVCPCSPDQVYAVFAGLPPSW
jgi:hypothetical protein